MHVQPIDMNLIRSVGDPFVTGDVDERVFARLCELTQDPPQFNSPVAACATRCERCRFTGGGETTYYRVGPGRPTAGPFIVSATSQGVLWVPGDGCLWVCSRRVTHDIDAHAFRPPDDFCEAVLRCPPMRSMQYLKAVLANGGRELHFGKGGTS